MNYRHIYHAGGFSDVFKHVLLFSLVQSLLRKQSPFCYLETHAGIGRYDLQKQAAQQSREFAGGVLKLRAIAEQQTPTLVADYLQAIRAFDTENASNNLRYYPGSPCLVRGLLRPAEQMILCELHARDVLCLKEEFKGDAQVAVHHTDGYQALKAFLPPKQRRGLVFIDPSFEKPDEFQQITAQLIAANQRWPTGMFAVWYPIKADNQVRDFYRQLQQSGIREILCCELSVPFAVTNLNTCGMIVVRPPWQWQQQVEKTLPWICQALSKPGLGDWQVKWLVPE